MRSTISLTLLILLVPLGARWHKQARQVDSRQRFWIFWLLNLLAVRFVLGACLLPLPFHPGSYILGIAPSLQSLAHFVGLSPQTAINVDRSFVYYGWNGDLIPLSQVYALPHIHVVHQPGVVNNWAMMGAVIVSFLGVVGLIFATVTGVAELAWTAFRLSRIPHRSSDGVTILIGLPGFHAFTFSTLFTRGRIYMTEAVWNSPHRAAVLEHENEHCSRRDSQLAILAAFMTRLMWFYPAWSRWFEWAQSESEKACDLAAGRVVGRQAYAAAMLAAVNGQCPAMSFGSLHSNFGGRRRTRHTVMLERCHALASVASSSLPLWHWFIFGIVYTVLLILL